MIFLGKEEHQILLLHYILFRHRVRNTYTETDPQIYEQIVEIPRLLRHGDLIFIIKALYTKHEDLVINS